VKILLSNSTGIFAGGEDYVLILATSLRQRGHQVWVSAQPDHLLLEKCEAAQIPTIPVRYAGMGRVFEVAGILRGHIRSLSIDIIHSNANYDRTCAALAAAWSPTCHIASVHSAHSIQHNITHWLRNRFGIDQFIAVADAVKDVLVRQDRIPEQRITVVPIGVESNPRELEAQWRVRTRKELGAGPDTIVIGNVARLVPFKGHRILLDAIAEVVKRNSRVLFPIAGDGELLRPLQEQASQLNIEPYVRFLGFRDNLQEIYPAFDIYTHSSREMEAEAFPLAILHALAARLPVVSTEVGGIGNMVEDGVSGFLTPPESPHELAEALLKVIDDRQLRGLMGEASFSLFLTRFQASAMAAAVEEVYSRTVQNRRKTHA
jgi:glycosyltransferase involved in cell wall biosynthesis